MSHLLRQKIDYSLEGIEAEGSGDGRAQVRVGVHIVEDHSAVRRLQVLDTAHVESGGPDESLAAFHRNCRNVTIRIKLDRRR